METAKRTSTLTVYAEFCDIRGMVVAQGVYTDWRKRHLPVKGDALWCIARSPTLGRSIQVMGRVAHSACESQLQENGTRQDVARLLLLVTPAATEPARPKPALRGRVYSG